MVDDKSEENDIARQAQMNGWEAVYPCIGHNDNKMCGLTKRELFAAMAMQGLVANPEWERSHHVTRTAMEAVGYADALLKELAK